jgi:glycosyltransferase involved in cell wall biosynthesis
LFFTPVLPGTTGQGTAMRAGVALELLAEKYEVTVVHVEMWTGSPEIADWAWPRKKAAAYHLVTQPVAPDAAQNLVAQQLAAARFDAVYVFRLVVAPFALQVMNLLGKLPNALDLDDDECSRTEKFLPIRDAAGDTESAERDRAELHRQRGFQRIILMRFDVSLLASEEDRDALGARYPAGRFRLLPNVVRLPEPAPRQDTARSLLFLGTLDYLPNEDAVLYFSNAVLPLLLSSEREIDFRVVGIKTPKSIQTLSTQPGVTVVGTVKDVAAEYARARLMVVPLRVGSGTRIKILEAFAFNVPVVSTSIGAAGLDLVHGVHLLIADTPEEFAAACLRLLHDDELAATLARNAHAWLRESHSLDRARAVLHSLFPAQANATRSASPQEALCP